jgi:hypothetical protein
MSWLPDVMVSIGSVLISVGVYLEFGIAYALIVAGVCVGALAMNMARILNASDTSETRDV